MKTSALAPRGMAPSRVGAVPLPAAARANGRQRKPAAPAGVAGRQQKIEERIAAATEELASGITEAASAAEELRRAMEQIATGAEEAASASQQTLAVATTTATTLAQARDRAEAARRRTETLQGQLAETSN
ncbi:MAG: methyl-accepting chemotaxis protein, partial [Xanthobacteraceae bacterium]